MSIPNKIKRDNNINIIKIPKNRLFIYSPLSFLLILVFFNSGNLAIAKNKIKSQNNSKTEPSSLPIKIIADRIDGDANSNKINASGNVELLRNNAIIYADKVIYDKNTNRFEVKNNIKIQNIEVGNVYAESAEMKEDFSAGSFNNAQIIINNGSFLISPKIIRENKNVTILEKAIISLCPNPLIDIENKLEKFDKDLISIDSSTIKIDKKESSLAIKGAIINFYKVPVFYIPYLKIPLPGNQRKSGFLSPSYAKNNRFGIGLITPYYIAISEDKELTITPHLYSISGQIILNNKFEHLSSFGRYMLEGELANNKIQDSQDTVARNRTQSNYRWTIKGLGSFDFTKNIGANFSINRLSDSNYLRDYYYDYTNYSVSKANFDYIYQRSYHNITAINFQELEYAANTNSTPTILPTIESHIETKPFLFKEKLLLNSNYTNLTRSDGLRYQRLLIAPEINLPANFYGNLFSLNGKFESDIYYLKNDNKSLNNNTNFDKSPINYQPEGSLSWHLPLLRKSKNGTLTIEPMANFVVSSFKSRFQEIPNEDSNNSELTISNLFLNDRIAGFDRSEVGKRFNYGVRTAYFNNDGEYRLSIGQSIKKSNKLQDISIIGFNSNSKSNIVGELYYNKKNWLNITYNFQLNEKDYQNDINEVIIGTAIYKLTINGTYLLIKKTTQNTQEIQQTNLLFSMPISKKTTVDFNINRDITNKRNITRSIAIKYDGCCSSSGFAISENNQSSLLKPQRSFKINFTIKN